MSLADPLHLSATSDFIEANATDFSIERRSRVSDGSGGTKLGAPESVAGLHARFIGINSVNGVQSRTLPDGKIVTLSGKVIAMPDADVKVGDILVAGASKFEVLTVSFNPPWRLSAEVTSRG